MTLWRFEFFRVGEDGKRTGPDVMTDGSASLEQAIAEAKSVMRNRTFHFGKATVCLVKRQDGSIVREVSADQ